MLVSPRNPLNIGAAARAMSNFGVFRLRVVNAYPLAYQEARSAVNASAVLAASEQFETVEAAVADCTVVVGTTAVGHRELRHTVQRLEIAGRLLRSALLVGPVALLFGSEKFGLSNEDLSHCHWLVRIPAREEHPSMNLGQAVAVCLYEIIRRPRAATAAPKQVRRATAEQRQRFADSLLEVLDLAGYIPERTSVSSGNKVRRLIQRLQLSERDAVAWLGMVRQIRWKLTHPGPRNDILNPE